MNMNTKNVHAHICIDITVPAVCGLFEPLGTEAPLKP